MDRRDFIGLFGAGVVGLATGFSPIGALAQQFPPVEALAQEDNSLEGRIAQLQRRIEERPKDPNLHFELSKLYEEDVERYYDEALSEFEDAADRGLKGETVLWNPLGTEITKLGGISLKRGEYDKAIKNFERARVFNNNHSLLYNNIAMAYKGKKDYDETIKYMKKAIDLNPLDADFYISIGMTYLENKDFRLSILNLNRSMYLDDSSKNKDLLFNVAQAYKGLGEYSNAIEALDQLPRKLRKHDTVKAFRKECVRLLNN